MSAAQTTLEQLQAELEREGGLLAEALAPLPLRSEGVFAPLLEGSERLGGRSRDYGLVIESVLEGYLLHYGWGRLVATADHDLRLLAGDYMYAAGLDRLARLGDLAAVQELGELISLCARVHLLAAERLDAPWRVTSALWASAAVALAGGPWEEHRRLKDEARTAVPSAERILSAARERAAALGVGTALERALIAFDESLNAAGRTT